jgi:hypothetical protein
MFVSLKLPKLQSSNVTDQQLNVGHVTSMFDSLKSQKFKLKVIDQSMNIQWSCVTSKML